MDRSGGTGASLALFDLPSVAFTAVCFGLGLANIRRPAAHKRFMAATVIPGLSPALARLFQTLGSPSFFSALHASMAVIHVVPIALAFLVALHVVLVPVGMSAWWSGLMQRFAGALATLSPTPHDAPGARSLSAASWSPRAPW